MPNPDLERMPERVQKDAKEFIRIWKEVYGPEFSDTFLIAQFILMEMDVRDVRIHDNTLHIWCDQMKKEW